MKAGPPVNTKRNIQVSKVLIDSGMVQHAGFVPLDFVTVIKLLRLRERASVPSFASCSILYLFHSLPYCEWKKSCTTWDG
jgi:hypothetical protein